MIVLALLLLLVTGALLLAYRLYRTRRARVEVARLSVLFSVTEQLLDTLPPRREAFRSTLQALADLLEAPAVRIQLDNPGALPTDITWPDHHPSSTILFGEPGSVSFPILAGGERLGMVSCAARPQGPYQPDEALILTRLATALAGAMVNMRLYTEVSSRRDELDALVRLSTALADAQALQGVFDLVVQSVLDLTRAGDAHILLWNNDTAALEVAASAWRGRTRNDFQIRPNGLSMQVARSGQAMFIDDALSHPLHADGSAAHYGMQARAALPLRRDDQVFGVIICARYQPGPFSDREKRLLSALADQAALAVYNAQLYEAATSRAHELAQLLEVAGELTSTRRQEHTLRAITQAALDLTQADDAHVFLWFEQDARLALTVSSYRDDTVALEPPVPSEGGLTMTTAKTAQVLLTSASLPDGRPFARASLPLRHEGAVLGVLSVSKVAANIAASTFSAAEERVLRGLADYGALAIRNAQTLQELEALSELKSDFIATASHELKTPLMSLMGYAELLGDHEMDEATHRYAASAILSEAERMNEIIKDLLDAERVRRDATEPPEPTDMRQVVSQVAERLAAQANKRRLHVTLELPDTPLIVMAHVEELELIIGNLGSNALKYSHEGGEVTLSLRRDGETLLLVVADNGVGIAPEELPRLFERFYRVRKDPRVQGTRGTGLGLAIAREAARRHGGEVVAQSEGLNLGSRFTVTLPLATPTPTPTPTPAPS